MTYLPTLAGYTAIFPAALSDTGLVVGRASKPAPVGVRIRLRNQAFVWDAETGMHGLGTLPDDWASFASGVTREGRRISGFSVGDNRVRACVWDRDGQGWKVTALPQEAQLGSTTVPISDDGRHVAAVDGTRACLWSRNEAGAWTREVIAEPGALAPRSVNNAGTVVGVRFTGDGYVHAVLWSRKGGYKQIEKPPGYVRSEAQAINNADVIVGWVDGPFGSKIGPNAFVWEQGRLRLIDEGGPAFTSATAINDHGQVAGVFEADDEPAPNGPGARFVGWARPTVRNGQGGWWAEPTLQEDRDDVPSQVPQPDSVRSGVGPVARSLSGERTARGDRCLQDALRHRLHRPGQRHPAALPHDLCRPGAESGRREPRSAAGAEVRLDDPRLALENHARNGRGPDARAPAAHRGIAPVGPVRCPCVAVHDAHRTARARGSRLRAGLLGPRFARGGPAAAAGREDDRRAVPFVDLAHTAAARGHRVLAPGLQLGEQLARGADAVLVGRSRRLAAAHDVLGGGVRHGSDPARELAVQDLAGARTHGRQPGTARARGRDQAVPRGRRETAGRQAAHRPALGFRRRDPRRRGGDTRRARRHARLVDSRADERSGRRAHCAVSGPR